jgi:hypothetical protein
MNSNKDNKSQVQVPAQPKRVEAELSDHELTVISVGGSGRGSHGHEHHRHHGHRSRGRR